MLSSEQREYLLNIINDENCHLSFDIQQEIVEFIEKSDFMQKSIIKQNNLAAQSTLWEQNTWKH